MENKTAVEWLIENLSYIPFDKTIFQQALEMEKQQHKKERVKAYHEGIYDGKNEIKQKLNQIILKIEEL